MNRRSFLRSTALAAGSLPLLNNHSFASWLNPQTMQFKVLRNNVGFFTEQGGTIGWLSNKEGIAVVDAEFPEQARHLITELKKQSDKPFKWLINSHHHPDHTGGNIVFKGLARNVVAHANSLTNQKKQAAEQNKEDQQLYPDTTYTDEWKVKLGDELIHLHYFGPGHTNGDSLIHFENANIVHTGDLVFNRRYPRVDRKGGASVKNWINVLQKVQHHFDRDTLFIFGHAFNPEKVTGNMADIAAMQHFIERLINYVESGIKAGKSKDEILATKTIPGVTEWQGDGILYGLTATYEELSVI
ncbi:MBL fold metallo-hydrolase [Mucilaginibacter hurinus]|uniref:MBL fold metallo-hydrolase n=1 Tax=Mucilaginibacter hurinus TaxID=2201324 RepID=A0A367GUX2_9SPHI|nr:MBL fold metallo-hydrolase [Mucilaginibacter hurinus]RCH56581.1 MBL fold metallo-hydrolase [Mucilaginibacter hurinus]